MQKKALSMFSELYSKLEKRNEYDELMALIVSGSFEKAHDCFGAIRINITLNQNSTENELLFSDFAENVAKTIYNCSGYPAPFDNNSFHKMLKSFEKFKASASND